MQALTNRNWSNKIYSLPHLVPISVEENRAKQKNLQDNKAAITLLWPLLQSIRIRGGRGAEKFISRLIKASSSAASSTYLIQRAFEESSCYTNCNLTYLTCAQAYRSDVRAAKAYQLIFKKSEK